MKKISGDFDYVKSVKRKARKITFEFGEEVSKEEKRR